MKSYKPSNIVNAFHDYIKKYQNNVTDYISNNGEKIKEGAIKYIVLPSALLLSLNSAPATNNASASIVPVPTSITSYAAEQKINPLDYFHKTQEQKDEKIAENALIREQKTLEDYISKNIPSSFSITDLEGYSRIREDYKIDKDSKGIETKLLNFLNLDKEMKLSYRSFNVNGKSVIAYNVIDKTSDNPYDGNISLSERANGIVEALFDKSEKPEVKLAKSGLDSYNISAVMSDLIKSIDKGYTLYRISDGKDTHGFVVAPEDMKIKELLEEYDQYNGALLGSLSFDRVKRDGTTPTPTPTPIPTPTPTPQPSPEQELNDDNDPQDPANTGCDPNTGEGSTQTDPVVNPDPDPHVF